MPNGGYFDNRRCTSTLKVNVIPSMYIHHVSNVSKTLI
jgi:hypothetical protein